MKSIVYTKYGGTEVLQLSEAARPVPEDHEVLIRVRAVSINDWDWALVQGTPFVNRMMNGLFKPKQQVTGSDVAGRIEAVGKSVTRFKPGDDVFGDLSGRWGGLAEFVCAPEDSLILKPAGMTYEEAAAIPQAGMLAVQGLLDVGKIKEREKLLINGAGGGVGTFALQIARQYNAEVSVVDSPGKFDMLRAMGALHFIDYTKEDFTRSGKKYDLILDVKTNRSVFSYLRALNPGGRYVTVGGFMNRLLEAFLLGPFIKMFTGKKVLIVALKANKDLEYMIRQFESGQVRPVIDGSFTLEETRKAFELFSRAEHKGKIVVSVFHDFTAEPPSTLRTADLAVGQHPEC